jgi:hypothetical protein
LKGKPHKSQSQVNPPSLGFFVCASDSHKNPSALVALISSLGRDGYGPKSSLRGGEQPNEPQINKILIIQSEKLLAVR